MNRRENTKRIRVGAAAIGGGAGVSVQSMCNTRTSDVEATCAQIGRLAAAGCDIVRLAVPDMDAARAISAIKERTETPLVADIHFDYRLALEAAERGVDKIRINPGNIGSPERVAAVARECARRGIPIRIGVNGGSLERPLLEKYGHPTPEAMLESARGHIRLLNDCGFDDICLSLKASSPELTVAAYRLAAEELDYPLHLGVTETGTAYEGVIRSAVGIGTLLMEGIGDTIRVSLTADPVEEVRAGLAILRAAGLRRGGVRLVSCPTCGRTEIDLIRLAHEVEERLQGVERDITVAVMGCVVNGPGRPARPTTASPAGAAAGCSSKRARYWAR